MTRASSTSAADLEKCFPHLCDGRSTQVEVYSIEAAQGKLLDLLERVFRTSLYQSLLEMLRQNAQQTMSTVTAAGKRMCKYV